MLNFKISFPCLWTGSLPSYYTWTIPSSPSPPLPLNPPFIPAYGHNNPSPTLQRLVERDMGGGVSEFNSSNFELYHEFLIKLMLLEI